jgi:hypothetical protein
LRTREPATIRDQPWMAPWHPLYAGYTETQGLQKCGICFADPYAGARLLGGPVGSEQIVQRMAFGVGAVTIYSVPSPTNRGTDNRLLEFRW